MVNISQYKVPVEELRWDCDKSEFEFKHTGKLPKPQKLEDIVKGQETAKKQLKEAIRLRQNVILNGPPGCGKTFLIKKLTEQYNQKKIYDIELQDQLLAYNFDEDFEPLALILPTPKGKQLRNDLNQFIKDVQKGNVLLGELNPRKRKKIFEEIEEGKAAKDAIEKHTEKVKTETDDYLTFGPNSMQQFYELIQMDIEPIKKVKRTDYLEYLQYKWEETDEKIKKLESLLNPKKINLPEKYADYPKVKSFLEKIIEDLKENPLQKPKNPLEAMMMRQQEQNKELEKYKVNLIVNNEETTGIPIQFIENPTIQNMIGDVQHDPYGLGGRKPHMRVKAGKLPKANGGIAVIDEIINVFQDKTLCNMLLSSLEDKKVRIGGGHGIASGGTSAGIETQPVNSDSIIIGCSNEDVTKHITDKMNRRFKEKIDFETNMENTKENRLAYAHFIKYEVDDYNSKSEHKEKIVHFDPSGVAALVEEGARFATRQENIDKRKYLTNVLDAMKEILQKAGLKAIDSESKIVKREHVEKAIEDVRRSAKKRQREYIEKVKNGSLVLHLTKEEVGYVNGLVVYSNPFKKEYFGFPARLEAITSAGDKGLVTTIEGSKLSGDVFAKSHNIITGYFDFMYKQDGPKFFEAKLDFNQLYNPLEGDSASIATVLAFESAFSEIPIKQSIAVTGSMNQRGKVQAIGGANEKIEGFYRLCKELGLLNEKTKGKYGVIIPKTNVQSLMLDKEVVEDIRKKRFSIYAVEHIDEVKKIIMNVEPEEVYKKVKTKIDEYTKSYKKHNKN